MALTGRHGWKFVASDGKDLSAPSLQHAELIKRGDLLVFNHQTQLLQIRRIERGKRIIVSETHLPTINDEKTFRLLAENVRDVSRLDLVEVPMAPPYWAYRFV